MRTIYSLGALRRLRAKVLIYDREALTMDELDAIKHLVGEKIAEAEAEAAPQIGPQAREEMTTCRDCVFHGGQGAEGRFACRRRAPSTTTHGLTARATTTHTDGCGEGRARNG